MDSYLPSGTLPRLARHVTAIQVRNLTPFPARDAFASALTQPAEQSQFTAHGRLSDDLDVTLSRKRSRRISNNSVATHRTRLSGDSVRDDLLLGTEESGRRLSTSKSSLSEKGRRNRQNSTPGPTSVIRFNRQRTASLGSSSPQLLVTASPSTPPRMPSVPPLTTIMHDISQSALEQVIESRLVETFLAITISSNSSVIEGLPSISEAPDLSRNKPRNAKSVEGSGGRTNQSFPPQTDKGSPVSRHSQKVSSTHARVASTSSSRFNGYSAYATCRHKPTDCSPSCYYFSHIHGPSTNPSFFVDISSNLTDDMAILNGHAMRIEIWGNIRRHGNFFGKGKERDDRDDHAHKEWDILEGWNVDLDHLVPLSDDFLSHSSDLPSNTLIITLSPPGRTFYLPSPLTPTDGEFGTHSQGYSSDPETEAKKIAHTSGTQSQGLVGVPSVERTRQHDASLTGRTKTPTYQELLRLVNLQSIILDHENSLATVVGGIESMLKNDNVFTLRREVSEREARLEELVTNHKKVTEDSRRLKISVEARSRNLKQRRQILASAMGHYEEAVDLQRETATEIFKRRDQYQALQAQLGPTRTTLLNILSSIFPIELSSPPDLLYTILDVPLPIPLLPSDPAPPLALPEHREVTEEAIATSLGYVAQVVQLLSDYLGKRLVYPVTCVGSRSLIRDDISAMVGPRMFPLYSKGVDGYRFEYGVFLLNKDVELLMADRDLRAMDMRHTLPNLKNLLLTLTDGEGAILRQSGPLDLAKTFDSDMLKQGTSDPSTSTVSSEVIPEGLASGSTTPTAIDTLRRPRSSFLQLPPITGFFRVRHAPTSDPTNTSEPTGVTPTVGPEDHETGAVEDEEDRRTISGVSGYAGARDGRALSGGEEKLCHEMQDLSLVDADPSMHQ